MYDESESRPRLHIPTPRLHPLRNRNPAAAVRPLDTLPQIIELLKHWDIRVRHRIMNDLLYLALVSVYDATTRVHTDAVINIKRSHSLIGELEQIHGYVASDRAYTGRMQELKIVAHHLGCTLGYMCSIAHIPDPDAATPIPREHEILTAYTSLLDDADSDCALIEDIYSSASGIADGAVTQGRLDYVKSLVTSAGLSDARYRVYNIAVRHMDDTAYGSKKFVPLRKTNPQPRTASRPGAEPGARSASRPGADGRRRSASRPGAGAARRHQSNPALTDARPADNNQNKRTQSPRAHLLKHAAHMPASASSLVPKIESVPVSVPTTPAISVPSPAPSPAKAAVPEQPAPVIPAPAKSAPAKSAPTPPAKRSPSADSGARARRGPRRRFRSRR